MVSTVAAWDVSWVVGWVDGWVGVGEDCVAAAVQVCSSRVTDVDPKFGGENKRSS